MPGSSTGYDVQPGTSINETLQYYPQSVIVDNYSPYWIYLPDAGRYVPPYSTGGAYPLAHATSARMSWSAPDISGIAQLPLIPTAGMAHLNFTDQDLNYTPATPLGNSVFLQSQAFTIAEGQTLDLSSAPLDFLAIGVRVDNPGGTTYALGSTGIIAPQWTNGFTVDINPPFNSIIVAPVADPAGRSNTTRGGPVTVTFYAASIGNNPGLALPTPTDIYLANQMQFLPGAVDSNAVVLAVSGVTPGNIVYLRNLSAVIPATTLGVSQSYSLYQSTGTVLGGKQVTPTAVDPASPSLPATVWRPRQRNEISGTTLGALATATISGSGTMTAYAPARSAGDLLVLHHGCGNNTSLTSPVPTGWARAASATYTTTTPYAAVETLLRIADGTSADNALLTLSATAVHKAVIARYPAAIANSAALNGTPGTTTWNNMTNPNLPSITPSAPYAIALFAFAGSSGTITGVANAAARQVLLDNTTFPFWVGDQLLFSGATSLSGLYAGLNTTSITGCALVACVNAVPSGSFIIPTLGQLLGTLGTAPAGATTSYDIRTLYGVAASAKSGTDLVVVSSGGANLNETLNAQLSIEP